MLINPCRSSMVRSHFLEECFGTSASELSVDRIVSRSRESAIALDRLVEFFLRDGVGEFIGPARQVFGRVFDRFLHELPFVSGLS